MFTNNSQISINPVFNLLEGDKYTKIGIAIILQVLEGLHALCYRLVSFIVKENKTILNLRKGQELSWFCPSVFFYLVAVCPSVWILEIEMTSIRCYFEPYTLSIPMFHKST